MGRVRVVEVEDEGEDDKLQRIEWLILLNSRSEKKQIDAEKNKSVKIC